MRIPVIGSTGGSGRQIVSQALERGHTSIAHPASPTSRSGFASEAKNLGSSDEVTIAERRWEETWQLMGQPAPAAPLRRLAERYAEPHRAYHDLRHVLACLDLARSVRSRLGSAPEVELALWYHDAIYEPRAADNEARSAELATAELSELRSLAGATLISIADLILATRHAAAPAGHDAQFVVDIDLAILGSEPGTFDLYEAAIRREYRWVPGPLYRRKRREILQSFLDRPRIYSTAHFHALFEDAARANLGSSLSRLS
jgi:predicted metal-dependent HD superfamily phosphohydrolase